MSKNLGLQVVIEGNFKKEVFASIMSKTLLKGGWPPLPASAGPAPWWSSLHLRVQILMASGRSPHLSSQLSLLLGPSINDVVTKKNWTPTSVPHFHSISLGLLV